MSATHTAIPETVTHERACLLAAAGLLHDLGKVFQPAEVELSGEIRNLESMICPTDSRSGKPTHAHVLYTAFALDRAESNYGGLDREELFRVACYHHRPSTDSLEQNLLTKADWLASGHDRRAAEVQEKVTGLAPALARMQWPDRVPVDKMNLIVPTEPLDWSESKFLPAAPQTREEYGQKCRVIGEHILKGLNADYRDPAACVAGLLQLASRTMQAVPASRDWRQQPDVSLFDHSRIVAAFAACLAVQYPSGTGEARDLAGRFRLVGIGLGSIQKFLFRAIPPLDAVAGQSAEKGMAKQLRARSFFVSLLSWFAARRVLDSLGLPAVNTLIDAGGRSILLIPDTPEILDRLHVATRYLDDWFSNHIGGVLRLDWLVSGQLDDASFGEDSFASTFRQFDEQFSAARQRFPYAELRDEGGWVEDGWVADSESLHIDRGNFHEQLRRFGEQLPKADYLSVNSDESGRTPAIDVFGYRIQLHSDLPKTGSCFVIGTNLESIALPQLVTARHVPRMTADNLPRLAELAIDLGGTESEERKVGNLLMFEELACLSLNEEGAAVTHGMLGALKADVDRLGLLLGYGLGREKVSFGRFASVARTLDQFFKGFLTQKLQDEFPQVYTVFAGGDDLFLIGPWFDLIRLTTRLPRWFSRLCCDNRNVTFSAGIVFASPHTPVSHLAEHAEEALHLAKDAGRNRITIGSNTMSWSDYAKAFELSELMRRASMASPGEAAGLNPSLLYRLLRYAQMASSESQNPADLKWRAQMSYDLKRNLPTPQSEDSLLTSLHEQLLSIRSRRDARVLYTAATLTLYQLRGDG